MNITEIRELVDKIHAEGIDCFINDKGHTVYLFNPLNQRIPPYFTYSPPDDFVSAPAEGNIVDIVPGLNKTLTMYYTNDYEHQFPMVLKTAVKQVRMEAGLVFTANSFEKS